MKFIGSPVRGSRKLSHVWPVEQCTCNHSDKQQKYACVISNNPIRGVNHGNRPSSRKQSCSGGRGGTAEPSIHENTACHSLLLRYIFHSGSHDELTLIAASRPQVTFTCSAKMFINSSM